MTKSKEPVKKKIKPKIRAKLTPKTNTGTKEVSYKPKEFQVCDKVQRMADRIINGLEIKYDPMIHIPMLLKVFKEGYNVCTFCADAEICRRTFYKWVDKHPEFDKSYVVAKALAQDNWEKKPPKDLMQEEGDGKFNDKLYWGIMKSRFGYTDSRVLDLPKLRQCKNPQEQIDCLIDYISKGTLTAQEGQVLSSLVQTALKVEENTELKAKIEELEEVVEGLNGAK
jgi:hypothetical protein